MSVDRADDSRPSCPPPCRETGLACRHSGGHDDGPPAGPLLVGVGVGPGDPDLVTVRAVRVLRAADVVFVPVSDGHGPYGPRRPRPAGPHGQAPASARVPRPAAAPASARAAKPASASPPGSSGPASGAAGGTGRAEATVRAHVDHDRIRRLPFAMTGRADYTGPARTVVEALTAGVGRPAGTGGDGGGGCGGGGRGCGPVVAFATIGDPNLYSTFTALAAAVRRLLPGVRVRTVPGITAMQDLAARSGTVLAHGAETLALLPLTAGADAYRAALDAFDTVVAYKGGRALPRLLAALAEAGRLDGPHGDAVYGAALGLPDQDIRRACELPPDATGPYLSTLLATRRTRWPA